MGGPYGPPFLLASPPGLSSSDGVVHPWREETNEYCADHRGLRRHWIRIGKIVCEGSSRPDRSGAQRRQTDRVRGGIAEAVWRFGEAGSAGPGRTCGGADSV